MTREEKIAELINIRDNFNYTLAPREVFDDAIEALLKEPKTGHWIVDGSVDCYLDKVRCHCSECGKKKEFPADYDHIKQELSISYKNPEFIDNYCPNCGAKMQEVEE